METEIKGDNPLTTIISMSAYNETKRSCFQHIKFTNSVAILTFFSTEHA